MALSRPTQWTLGRCVIDPNPPASASLGRVLQHLLDADSGGRSVPPGTHGEQRVRNADRIAVDGKRTGANGAEPVGRFLTLAISRVEIMISGTHQQPASLCHRS